MLIRSPPVRRLSPTIVLVWVAMVLIAVVVAACSPRDVAMPPDVGPLAIGVVLTAEALPLYAAEFDRLYANYNVDVTLVPFDSPGERDLAIARGELDGVVHDLVSAALLNRDQDVIRAIKLVYRSTPDTTMVSLVAPAADGARDSASLATTTIAATDRTVAAYAADRLLDSRGIPSSERNRLDVASPARGLDALLAGEAGAVAMIEPFTSVALARGGRVVADDRGTMISQSVLSFRRDSLAAKGTSIRRFLRAHERAVEAVNANPTRYRPLLSSWVAMPDAVAEGLIVPRYPTARAPAADDVRGVIRWLVGRGLLPEPMAYERIVDATFVAR